MELWDEYEADLIVDRLTAGIPANPKLMQAWLEVNGAPSPAISDQAAMVERLDPNETHAVVFYRDMDGLPTYESRNFKAALREGANILKGMMDIKAFRSKLAERVFAGPRLVPITVPVQAAERPISVMTMQGPRTSIKRFEYAEDVPMHFDIRILRDNVVKPAHVETILLFLQDNGIGADRSQGSGTFRLLKFGPK